MRHVFPNSWLPTVLVFTLVIGLTSIICNAQSADPRTPVTTANPAIPLDHLQLRLKPLTSAELKTEADGWLQLLKSKATEISDLEITIRSPEEQPEDVRATRLEALAVMREERVGIIDRLEAVLDAYKTKGGDRSEYDLYISAVSGMDIDISDARTSWAVMTGWLTSREGGRRVGKNLLLFIGTLIVFYILGLIGGALVRRAVGRLKWASDLMRDFLVRLTSRGILLIGFVIALSTLEVNIGPLVAVIGAAGFVVAFALQGTLSNFASGLMILMYRPFDVGDVINTAGVAGVVESMSLVSTTITTFDNQKVVIPNDSIWGSVITNVTGKDKRRVDMLFGIAYDDDMSKAASILEDIVSKHSLVLPDPAPVIRVHELGDSSVNLICRPWTKTSDYWTVYWDITQQAKERFDQEGITIPFPQRHVHLHQQAAATK